MTDAELIEHLGGAAKVADLLGYDKKDGGIQRVHNWIERGIPAKVKLEHPAVFLQHLGTGTTQPGALDEATEPAT